MSIEVAGVDVHVALRVELDATMLDGIDVKYEQRPAAWSPPATLPPPR